jgi:hypothetical protein
MTAEACLKKAVTAGAELYVEAGRLRGRGPRPEPELTAALREHEAEIVALLASRELAAPRARPSSIEIAAAALAATAPALVTPVPPIGAPWPEPKITGNPPFGLDHVPARYEAGWQALLAGCPPWATGWQRDEAIFSLRDLFAEWGAELLRLNWQSKDIFDRWHGLGWFLKGKAVTALGVRHAFIEDGRVFEKVNA